MAEPVLSDSRGGCQVMKKYRTFSVEFKEKLVAQIEGGAISLSQAAREHQLSPSLVDRWRKQYRHGELIHQPSTQEKAMARELERCKQKIADLLLENDLLKKLQTSSRSARRSSGSVVTLKNLDRSAGPAK